MTFERGKRHRRKRVLDEAGTVLDGTDERGSLRSARRDRSSPEIPPGWVVNETRRDADVPPDTGRDRDAAVQLPRTRTAGRLRAYVVEGGNVAKDMQIHGQCQRCNEVLPTEQSFCSCGHPTPFATFKERNEFEAKKWRSYKSSAAH